jgi:hypothetical protein|tara:strand:+ start:204 stop:1238 length:1035 start_codon:yes stop_codon:yes gene_type:complete
MKQHEREFFVATIRTGTFAYRSNGIVLKLRSPTIEDQQDASEIYISHYEESYEDGVMTEEETLEWMEAKELWTAEDEASLDLLEKEVESCKERIYESRYVPSTVESLRTVIDKGKEQVLEAKQKKGHYSPNTCEGMASLEKARYLIKKNTYLNGELYDFSLIDVDALLSAYNASILSEDKIREIARNDPWKINWYMKDIESATLFSNKGREFTPNQNNLIIWSKMYDSVNESSEAPGESVIKDDYMLDGWFIVQRKKREKAQSEKEFEQDNPKISGAGEVYIMAGNKEQADKIDSLNSPTARMIKKQRKATMARKGGASQSDFKDVKLDASNQSHQQFKDKFRR